MKLAKKDRERLYKAKGQSITIAWPEEMKDLPRKGKRYTVHGEDGKKAFSVRVVDTRHAKYEVAAEVKIDEDAFKPMIGIGGVRRDDGSYETEPERAPDAYVALLCNEAEARNALLQGEATRRRRSAGLKGELKVAQERGRSGRARVLEAKMAQENKRAAFPSHEAA